MNLRELNIDEMVAVGRALLNPKEKLLGLMQSDRLLNSFIPNLEQTHTDALSVQQKVSSKEKQIKKLTAEMTELDALHDRKVRGVYNILTGAMDLVDRPEDTARYAALVEQLFPKGVSVINRNYRDQAGTARRVEDQLTPEARTQLAAVKVDAMTALDGVEVWLDAGQRIGRHEAERAQLKVEETTDGISAQDVRQVRIGWIQTVKALLSLVPLSSLDHAEQRTLLADMQDASKKALLRGKPKAQSGDNKTSDQPTPADETPSLAPEAPALAPEASVPAPQPSDP